jgi:hypothetical protein
MAQIKISPIMSDIYFGCFSIFVCQIFDFAIFIEKVKILIFLETKKLHYANRLIHRYLMIFYIFIYVTF